MDSENHNAGSRKSDNTLQSYQYWEEKTDGYVIKYGELKSDVIKASHCWYISGAQNFCILYQIFNKYTNINIYRVLVYENWMWVLAT